MESEDAANLFVEVKDLAKTLNDVVARSLKGFAPCLYKAKPPSPAKVRAGTLDWSKLRTVGSILWDYTGLLGFLEGIVSLFEAGVLCPGFCGSVLRRR